jgi:hypothetical protein
VKAIERTHQSITIAYPPDIAPQEVFLANIYERPTRTIHIEKIETVIVNFASFAARSEAGIVKEIGHINNPQIL